MITPEETEAGLQAYEQVQAFAALRRRRMGLVYTMWSVLLSVMGVVVFLNAGSLRWPGALCTLTGVSFALFAIRDSRRLRRTDKSNRALLAELEAKYGDALPWLEVERQQAEIRRIQSEQDA